MFRNYLKTAFRNLLKHKTLSAVNILGLAVGIASCLLIVLHVKKELAYDRGFSKADRIYRVTVQALGEDARHWAATSPIIGAALIKNMPEIEQSVRFYRPLPYMLFSYTRADGEIKKFEENKSLFADAGVVSMFDLGFVKGNPQTALTAANTIVLTEKMAEKYFGAEDPIGKTIQDTRRNRSLKVTGVIRPFPFPAHFEFDCLLSMEGVGAYVNERLLTSNSWAGMYNYVLVRKEVSKASLDKKMADFTAAFYAQDGKTAAQILSEARLNLQPLTDIHLGWKLEKEMVSNSDRTYVYIFSAAAALILLLAAINFINISTSQAFNRMKEIGMRKVIGASRLQLIKQFLGESLLVTLIAAVLALLLFKAAVPFYEDLGKGGSAFINLVSPVNIAVLVLMILCIGLLAGLYPAWFVSKFNPVASLKTKKLPVSSVHIVRKGLIVFQFVVSVFMIFSTVVIYRQMRMFHDRNLGFDKEQMVAVTMYPEMWKQYEALANGIRKNPAIMRYATVSRLPGERLGSYSFEVVGENSKADGDVREMWSDDRFLATMGMELKAGRNFRNQYPVIKNKEYILNEAAVNAFRVTDPVNKLITVDGDTGTIVGVVKDFNFASLHARVEPLVIKYEPDASNYFLLKVKAGSIPEVLSFMDQQIKTLLPGSNFTYSFLDERLALLYETENRMSRLFKVFACLAVFISCLGLFGLSSYATRLRIKEVGIRKALGASVSGITLLLSKDFMKLVLIGTAIALPLAWWFSKQWLDGFAYRVGIDAWVFVASGLFALTIAAVTVSFQSIRTASVKPVDTLSAE